jgi:hypothetical protein
LPNDGELFTIAITLTGIIAITFIVTGFLIITLITLVFLSGIVALYLIFNQPVSPGGMG